MRMLRWHLTIAGAGLLAIGLTLGGCKSSSNPTGTGPGSVITVTGTVLNTQQNPITNLAVLIPGKTSVNVDGNGTFTVSGVTTPYDIWLIDGTTKGVTIWRGLSRSDPTLVAWYYTSVTPNLHSATISGSIYPTGAYPNAKLNVAAFTSATTSSSFGTAHSVSPATFSSTITWHGASTITGTLHSLVATLSSSLPSKYDYYGSRTGVQLTDGTTLSSINDTMTTTIGTDTLAGTVSLPTGYSVSSKSVGIQTSDGGSISLFTDGSTSTSFTYNLPAISGAKAVVGVVATDPSGAFIEYQSDAKATNAKGVSISIPTAVTQSLPVTGATNVKAGQVFSWNPLSQGLNLVIFTGPAGQPRVTVITTAASDTLPSLSAVGLSYPTAANYTWLVGALAPFSNTDAMAGSSTFTKFTVLSETAARTFTTAP